MLQRADLSLSSRQRTMLRTLDAAWTADKAKLLQAMAAYEPTEGRSDQIAEKLQGYSELSRTYDATRSSYWAKARQVLGAAQIARLNGGEK